MCCTGCWTRASHERRAVARMAAERDAVIARACRLGAALSRLAAVPHQRACDGRAGDDRDHDRGLVSGAVARAAGPERAGPRGTPGAAIGRALVRYRRVGARYLRTHPVRGTRYAGDGGVRRAAGGASWTR